MITQSLSSPQRPSSRPPEILPQESLNKSLPQYPLSLDLEPINLPLLQQPNSGYLPSASKDTPGTHNHPLSQEPLNPPLTSLPPQTDLGYLPQKGKDIPGTHHKKTNLSLHNPSSYHCMNPYPSLSLNNPTLDACPQKARTLLGPSRERKSLALPFFQKLSLHLSNP